MRYESGFVCGDSCHGLPSNRPIAFPYCKRMVANSAVNQGAGFLVTSLANALAHGVPEDRLVYVGRGAAAHEPEDFLARDGYLSSPSMAVSLRRALELNRLTFDMLDFVELYSCFPCVPKMARRVLGWPLEKPATVFGGAHVRRWAHRQLYEPRGGQHGAAAARAGTPWPALRQRRLRDVQPQPRAHARTAPAGTPPQSFEHQAEADAARGPVPSFVEDFTGPGRIETYTVLYERDGSPRFGSIVGRGASGERFLAKVPAQDTSGIDFLCDGKQEPVGTEGHAVAGPGGGILWCRI